MGRMNEPPNRRHVPNTSEELLIRLVAQNGRRNSRSIYDLVLLVLCLLEAALPLVSIGQGQFAILSLRWLHLVRSFRCLPRESMATMAAFGALPIGVLLLLGVVQNQTCAC